MDSLSLQTTVNMWEHFHLVSKGYDCLAPPLNPGSEAVNQPATSYELQQERIKTGD